MRPRPAREIVVLTALGVIAGCRFGYEVIPGREASDGGDLPQIGGLGGVSPDGGASTGGAASGGNGGHPSTGGEAGHPSTGGMGGDSSGGAGTGGTPFGVSPYCEGIHELPSAPVIDGQLDAPLVLQDIEPAAFRFPADNPDQYKSFPSGVSMRYAVAYRSTGLYFYLDVTDPDYRQAPGDEWGGDGVEIYVDHDAVFAPAGSYDVPGTYSFIFVAPPDAAGAGDRAGFYTPYVRQGDFTGQWISKGTAGGYAVEAFIVAADLGLTSWDISPESSLAFDVGHNMSFPDSTTTGDFNRLGQYFLKAADPLMNVEADYPFFDSSVFCQPDVLEN